MGPVGDETDRPVGALLEDVQRQWGHLESTQDGDPCQAFWPPVPAKVPAILATPEGLGRVLGAGQLGRADQPPSRSNAPAPLGCGAIPKSKLEPVEALSCAEQALLQSSGVRVESYVHVVDPGAREPSIQVEAEAIYRAPASVQTRTDLNLRDISQLRSEVIQVEEMRFSRTENYNRVSGRRVVPEGWQRELVNIEDRSRLLDGVGMDYLVRLAAQRSGLVSPDSTRCADDVAVFLEAEDVAGRLHHVVQVRSAVTTPSGDPCVHSARTTTTHWLDSMSFRPWRIVMESVPPDSADTFSGEARQATWTGQTVYSDFDRQFEIEPPVALPQ